MPLRLRIDRGGTIGPLQTQYWNWNWFGEGGGVVGLLRFIEHHHRLLREPVLSSHSPLAAEAIGLFHFTRVT